MAMELFSKEYNYLRQYVRAGNFVDPAKKATDGLKTFMTDDGFDAASGRSSIFCANSCTARKASTS